MKRYAIVDTETLQIVAQIDKQSAVTAEAEMAKLGYKNPKYLLYLVVGGQGV